MGEISITVIDLLQKADTGKEDINLPLKRPMSVELPEFPTNLIIILIYASCNFTKSLTGDAIFN